MDLGVDGFRLDAVPYLYEREGTSCESLPETHAYLKKLRTHLDTKYGDRMLLAEANQWPEEAVTYFGGGKGDECHMAFHFPLMPRLFMAVRLEDRIPVTDILDQTPQIPETSQWALFLRNHDELTLEMVTDEERDYMYRVYASEAKARLNLGIRRRLAPLLKNDRKRIELLNLLLLSLPGTPVIYYGDEIGMGDNIFLGDRNGVRTPMHWSADKNAGFSRCTPQAIYAPIILDPEYHYEAVNVDTQQNNQHSLLWWTRRVLALRKRWKVFGFGTLEFLHPENRKVLAFIRRHEDQTVLVIANLSRFPQPVELDLSRLQGPRAGGAFWPHGISRHRRHAVSVHDEPAQHDVVLAGTCRRTPGRESLRGFAKRCARMRSGRNCVEGKGRDDLETCLPAFLQQRRWFATKGEIKSVRIRELIALPQNSEQHFMATVMADYAQSEPEEYLLPLAFASGAEAERLEREAPGFIFARAHIERAKLNGIIYDAAAGKDFGRMLFEVIARRRTLKSEHTEGSLVGSTNSALARRRAGTFGGADRGAQHRHHLRRPIYFKTLPPPGIRHASRAGISGVPCGKNFTHVPPFLGALELHRTDGEHTCLGILSGFIPNATRGWEFTQDALKRYFDRVRTLPNEARMMRA